MKAEWQFTEEQRDAVCRGELCPRCLSNNVECVAYNWDGVNANFAFDCQQCGEEWEGY